MAAQPAAVASDPSASPTSGAQGSTPRAECVTGIRTAVSLIGEPDRADGDLQTLHDLGCVISLDDFGRGYSTFAHLSRLPVDVLKMDREFLAGISDDQRSAALVHSVIELGNRLSIDVVAEGVETAGQLAALRELGCRYLQGFLLGRPVRPEELLAAVDAFDPALLDGSAAALAGVVPASE